jgi:hypothetical protein
MHPGTDARDGSELLHSIAATRPSQGDSAIAILAAKLLLGCTDGILFDLLWLGNRIWERERIFVPAVSYMPVRRRIPASCASSEMGRHRRGGSFVGSTGEEACGYNCTGSGLAGRALSSGGSRIGGASGVTLFVEALCMTDSLTIHETPPKLRRVGEREPCEILTGLGRGFAVLGSWSRAEDRGRKERSAS